MCTGIQSRRMTERRPHGRRHATPWSRQAPPRSSGGACVTHAVCFSRSAVRILDRVCAALYPLAWHEDEARRARRHRRSPLRRCPSYPHTSAMRLVQQGGMLLDVRSAAMRRTIAPKAGGASATSLASSPARSKLLRTGGTHKQPDKPPTQVNRQIGNAIQLSDTTLGI